MDQLENLLLGNETPVRLGFFFGVFALMAATELLWPRRELSVSKALRWTSNLGIVVLNTLIVRAIVPMGPVAFALYAEAQGWGLFNVIEVAPVIAVVGTIILMDFAIWLQHVMVHAIPVLWRLHRLHHADLDYDVTTGARFHPIEILLSVGIKLCVIALLGAPAVAVVIFEVILSSAAMFNHSNVKIPVGVDRVLRLCIVTPDMHRVHHSVQPHETNSNYGFNLPWWDRLFGTYIDQPGGGHEGMEIGIDLFRDPVEERLDKMLIQPFVGEVGRYPINRRDWNKKA